MANYQSISYTASYNPCETLGGDHYGVLALGEHRSLAFLDAAGHGVSAALLALQANWQIVSAQERLSGEVDSQAVLVSLLNELNDSFQQRRVSSYFTLFCAIVNPRAQRVTAVSCGHPSAVRLRADGIDLVASRSPAIGMLPTEGIHWDINEFTFAAGDELVLYSDGVVESENASGEFLSKLRC